MTKKDYNIKLKWLIKILAKIPRQQQLKFLSLYIDLKERKVTEFEDEKIKIMNDFILKNEINFNDKDLKFSNKLKK